MRFFGKILFMFSSSFLILFLVIFLNIKLHLGFSKTDMILFITPFLTLFNIFIMYPSLRNSFFKQFIKTKEMHLLIALPILLSIIELFLVYIYMHIPIFFNKNPVSIGSNQYVTSESLTVLGDFIMTSVFVPFNEEVIFRFLLLYYFPLFIFQSLLKIRKILNRILPSLILVFGKKIYEEIFIKKNRVIIFAWVTLTSSLFSIVHGPDLWSFLIYFPGGVICSYLFLRYGFLSAWIAHASFNTLSPFLQYVVMIFLSLFTTG